MSRTEARVFTSIWKDPQFRALSANAQRLYLFLLSQDDLTYCGTLALRERRWANTAAGLTIADVNAGLEELTADPRKGFANPSADPSGDPSGNPADNGGPFVVIDETTEECLVRTLMRHDGVWKVPNVLRSAHRSALLVESPKIRQALLDELLRIPIETASDLCKALHAVFVADLGGPPADPAALALANAPRRSPRKGSGKGSRKGFANPSRKGSGKGSPNPRGEGGRGNVGDKEVLTVEPSVVSETASAASDAPPPTPEPAEADEPERLPAAREAHRLDVERLCRHLADRIEGNGSRRPTITKAWRDAARLMLDRDGRTEEQIHAAIDWCQDDEFWRANILSMPKLRKQYDTLRLQALRQQNRRKPPRSSRAERNDAAYEAAMRIALAAEGRAAPDTTVTVTRVIPGEITS